MRLLRRRGDDVIAEADRLAGSGRALEAVDLLTRANREKPSQEVEARLVKIRNQAFAELGDPGSDFVSPKPVEPGDDPADDGLPAVAASELSAPVIRGAFLTHGCLIVRGLVAPSRAAELRAGIDHVFEGRDAHLDDGRRAVALDLAHVHRLGLAHELSDYQLDGVSHNEFKL